MLTAQEYIHIKYKKESPMIKDAIRDYNKKLIKKYPFLSPASNCCANELDNKRYDYQFTELDNLPDGWYLSFGIALCEEIKQALLEEDLLNDYKILQIKEKFGSLRWYDNAVSDKVTSIIDKYEKKSEEVCINCGKPTEYKTLGWINFLCKDCANEYGLLKCTKIKNE